MSDGRPTREEQRWVRVFSQREKSKEPARGTRGSKPAESRGGFEKSPHGEGSWRARGFSLQKPTRSCSRDQIVAIEDLTTRQQSVRYRFPSPDGLAQRRRSSRVEGLEWRVGRFGGAAEYGVSRTGLTPNAVVIEAAPPRTERRSRTGDRGPDRRSERRNTKSTSGVDTQRGGGRSRLPPKDESRTGGREGSTKRVDREGGSEVGSAPLDKTASSRSGESEATRVA